MSNKGLQTSLVAAHNHFLSSMGKFYEFCAHENVFEDSKTIVDMPLKAEPQLVIEEFERLFGKGEDKSGVHIRHDADQLRAFLATWFSNAGDDTEAVSSSCEYLTRDRSWGNELLASMQKLLRRARISSDASIRSTLIAAPNPFIIPGERFRESYYWDSHWIILGLLKRRNPQDLKVAMGIVENFAYMVEAIGMVPNGFRSYYLNRSQPPMLTAMVYALYAHTRSPDLIARFLPVMKIELMFWRTSERTLRLATSPGSEQAHVVSRYYADWTSPRPESLREDLATLEELKNTLKWNEMSSADQNIKTKQLFRDISAAAESGWDFSSRWLGPENSLSSIRTTRVLPVDLNALLMKSELLVSKMAGIVGDSESQKEFEQFGLQRAAALRDIFWDEARCKWRDVLIEKNVKSRTLEVSGFSREEDYASDWVPLWCTEDADQVSKSIETLRASAINAEGGIAASSIMTGQQWDWPNVWPPSQYFLAEGCLSASTLLAQAGEEHLSVVSKSLADSIKERFLHAARVAWDRVHTLPEKFDCRDAGACGSGGEYDCVQGFGWTTGLVIHWLDD